jgi:hypothetical protein
MTRTHFKKSKHTDKVALEMEETLLRSALRAKVKEMPPIWVDPDMKPDFQEQSRAEQSFNRTWAVLTLASDIGTTPAVAYDVLNELEAIDVP